jgi:hypothetical protein
MEQNEIERYFTREDGRYLFARWGRPIAPVVFGVDDATLSVIKGAIEAVVVLADHRMAETDPELGANLVMFFFRDWEELAETPNLDRLVPDFDALIARLEDAGANQYRLFRFDASGAIKAAFVFVRLDKDLAEVPAEDLALAQVAETMLLWSDRAFRDHGPLAAVAGKVLLHPRVAEIIRAAYDPVMPAVAEDPSHALRLAARIGAGRRQ